jgi:diguanylate cyclase (GGDEF)-like protein
MKMDFSAIGCDSFPKRVAERIFGTVVREYSPFYLLCDRSGRLLDQGGFREDYGFPAPSTGSMAQDEIRALFGLFPYIDDEDLFLPSVDVGGGRSADIHLFTAGEGVYVLFLDASRKESQLIISQQFLNDRALSTLNAAKGGRRSTDLDAARGSGARGDSAIDPKLLVPSHDLIARLLGKRLELFRATGESFGLVFVDIRGLKDINFEHGTDAGDAVLQTAAKVLHHSLWPGDVVGRWGGVVFACLAKAEDDSIEGLAAAIASAVGKATVRFGDARIHVTASISATLSTRGDSAESMVQRVESGLMDRASRNCGFSIVRPGSDARA